MGNIKYMNNFFFLKYLYNWHFNLLPEHSSSLRPTNQQHGVTHAVLYSFYSTNVVFPKFFPVPNLKGGFPSQILVPEQVKTSHFLDFDSHFSPIPDSQSHFPNIVDPFPYRSTYLCKLFNFCQFLVYGGSLSQILVCRGGSVLNEGLGRGGGGLNRFAS